MKRPQYLWGLSAFLLALLLKLQAIGVASTLVYSGVMTLILLMVTKALVGLRVNEDEERQGLDVILHGEQIL